ncbi:MAG: serine hydrolase [Candidatus Thorarchaeota archaeon]|nr:MAG: serine hydrolase [Candidatus Thorarchaeota archaeon]
MNLKQAVSVTLVLMFVPLLLSDIMAVAETRTEEHLQNHITDYPEYWPTQEWRVATPESQGMNSSILSEASSLSRIIIPRLGISNPRLDGMIVIRNGYIVFEEYPSGYGRNVFHRIYSCTKSFTSVLFGIAMDKGLISSLSQRVVDFFPDREIANLDDRKRNITLEDLLTMRTGMDWEEWTYPYDSDLNPTSQMYDADDSIQFILDREMTTEPGTQFAYCSGASMLLGEIIEIVSGMNILAFARKYLFTPIGIGELYWWKDYWKNVSYFSAEGGLFMTPRNMARFGYLMLNNGTWDNQEVVSASWVNTSTTSHLSRGSISGYGYQWWTTTGTPHWLENFINKTVYYAMGMEGQKICVVPDYNLVAVMTGEFSGATPAFYDNVVSDVIIESILRFNQTETSLSATNTFGSSEQALAILSLDLLMLFWYEKLWALLSLTALTVIRQKPP